MRILRHYRECPADAKGAVVALGNFDGVHLGHRALLLEAKRLARELKRPFGVHRLRTQSARVLPAQGRALPADAVPRQGAAARRARGRSSDRAHLRRRDGVHAGTGFRPRRAGEGARGHSCRDRQGFSLRQGPRRRCRRARLYGRDGGLRHHGVLAGVRGRRA